MTNGKIVTAIDIGTTKICVITAHVETPVEPQTHEPQTHEPQTHGHTTPTISILGIGKHPSNGLKRGIVIDINAASESIQRAATIAEQQSGIKIYEATVGLSGAHIQSFNSKGVIPIKYHDVDENDIERVLEASKNIPIPEGREILHVIPQFFKIDGQEAVHQSLGMRGSRLEAQVHIVTGAVWSADNIIKACRLAGIATKEIVLEQIASAAAVLSPSEQELGTAVLDIGGGTSDFAIYKHGRIIHSKVLPVAGTQFTNDLALCLGIPIPEAEKLKREHGTTAITTTPSIITTESKNISSTKIAEILKPRATELFELLLDEILKFNLTPLMRAGLVLTGGGSLLNNIETLAHDIFKTPTRTGKPPDKNLTSPIYATGYGLLIHATTNNNPRTQHSITKIIKKMKTWIYNFL